MATLRPISTLLAAGALGAALLPATAHAAPAVCLQVLPAPEGQSWKLASDGSPAGKLSIGAGRAFEAGHAQAHIGNLPYPQIGNAPEGCDRTGDTVTYPTRTIGTFTISRSVSSVGGRLRHLEIVKNTSNQVKLVPLTFDVEITQGQVALESENGDKKAAGNKDSWLVLNDDIVRPVLQWGSDPSNGNQDDGRERPDVFSGADAFWAPGIGVGDESARLTYEQADLNPGETVRFLHVTDVATSTEAGMAKAKDEIPSFKGYSQAVAKTVINYGPDPDLDRVPISKDACPALQGTEETGCPKFIASPVPPTDPVPAPGDPARADPGTGGNGGSGTPAATLPAPGTENPAADRTGPKVIVKGLASKIRPRWPQGHLRQGTPRVARLLRGLHARRSRSGEAQGRQAGRDDRDDPARGSVVHPADRADARRIEEARAPRPCVIVMRGNVEADAIAPGLSRLPEFGRFRTIGRKALSAQVTALIAAGRLERGPQGALQPHRSRSGNRP